MVFDSDNHDILSKVYEGTLELLLQQAIAVYQKAGSKGVEIDIMHMLRQTLKSSNDVKVELKNENRYVDSVMRVEKIELHGSPGKWCKNRNEEYINRKSKKNTKKKIKSEVEKKKCCRKSWSAGGPRPMLMLKSIGVGNILQVDMF